MIRGRQSADTDLHERFSAWLLHGAADEPPRDLALHAALCPECRADVAAFDLLPLVDTGRAPLPPSRHAPSPARGAGIGARMAWAAAAVAIIAVGGWALLSGRLPQGPASESPAQQVLGGFGAGELAASTPVGSGSLVESAEPRASVATAEPTRGATSSPAASPVGSLDLRSAAPTTTDGAGPSRPSRPTSSAAATPSPPGTATPAPTSTPTPIPECSDGIDNDGDGGVDFGLDPLVNDLQCLGLEDDSEELL